MIKGIFKKVYGLASPGLGTELPVPITVHLSLKILSFSYSKYSMLV